MSAEDANNPWCDQICRDFFVTRDEFAKFLEGVPENDRNRAKCLMWKQEFDEYLQERLSRVEAAEKDIQRHYRENYLEIEMYKHSTDMLGAPEYLQDEMRALMAKQGGMQAIDHIALKNKMTEIPKLMAEVKTPAAGGTEALPEEVAELLGIPEKRVSSELPVDRPMNVAGTQQATKPADPAVAVHPCNKDCSVVLSSYSMFLRQGFALPEDYLKKKELCEWCTRFGAKLVLHFADVKNLKKEFAALEMEGDAKYVDAMRRQMFTTPEDQHATNAYFASLLTTVTSMRDKVNVLCGEETHKKFLEELIARPKIKS